MQVGTTAATTARNPIGERDHGSVTPLVIGMMLCLLILGAGVIAAGSAVLARRNLQSACDGAAAAVAGKTTLDELASGQTSSFGTQMTDYLDARIPAAAATPGATATAVTAHCTDESPVTFGVLFGNPTVRLSVDSVSQVYRG